MKIKEILTEGGTGSLANAVKKAMPATVTLPALPNQDAYLQYRMGLAMAAARADHSSFEQASAFGENMTIVGYTDADLETIQLALKLMGKQYAKGSKLIGTHRSEEAADVGKTSPLAKKKKNKYGV